LNIILSNIVTILLNPRNNLFLIIFVKIVYKVKLIIRNNLNYNFLLKRVKALFNEIKPILLIKNIKRRTLNWNYFFRKEIYKVF